MVIIIHRGCLPYSNANARMVRMVHTMLTTFASNEDDFQFSFMFPQIRMFVDQHSCASTF